LYDGVHPSQFLSSIWYCALCQSIVNDINDKFSDELAMEENEENQVIVFIPSIANSFKMDHLY
jgi:hypothetical protein